MGVIDGTMSKSVLRRISIQDPEKLVNEAFVLCEALRSLRSRYWYLPKLVRIVNEALGDGYCGTCGHIFDKLDKED